MANILRVKDLTGNWVEIPSIIGVYATPAISMPYASQIQIEPNNVTNIVQLTGDCTITLADGISGYANEWRFVISQGATAYKVTLPTIKWDYNDVPTFGANVSTMVRIYYIGSTLFGEYRDTADSTSK